MRKVLLAALLLLSACKVTHYEASGVILNPDMTPTEDVLTITMPNAEDVTAHASYGETFQGRMVHEQAEVCPNMQDILANALIDSAFGKSEYDTSDECEVEYTGKSTLDMRGNQGNSLQCIFQANEYSHFPENGGGSCVYPDGHLISIAPGSIKQKQVDLKY